MIIDAYATDTVPSHEVRRRANEALAAAGEPMSEVTYDALRKRLAEAEEELSIWRSVFPDIAPERVLPDRRLLLNRIAELEAALRPFSEMFLYPDDLGLEVAEDIKSDPEWCSDANDLQDENLFVLRGDIRKARAALEGGKND